MATMRLAIGFWMLVILSSASFVIAGSPATQPSIQPATQPTSQPAATQPAEPFRAYRGQTLDLHSCGFHKLVYQWSDAGKTHQLAFSLYVPRGYGTGTQHWPMLTFLAGLGDRGSDPGNAMAVGVPLEIGRSADLGDWLPMLVLTPQCPDNRQWDSPGMIDDVLRLITAVQESFSVDSNRLYVTGFSDGGKGAWMLATHSPKTFAAVAPIVSREYQADRSAKMLADTNTSCLIISGLKDDVSEPASGRMAAALRLQKVDTAYAPIPNVGHHIWRAFYSQRRFYEWLMLHSKDRPPAKSDRADQSFIQLYQSTQQMSFDAQMVDYHMQRDLDRFEPYWFVDNCGQADGIGLISNLLGRKKVFVAMPLSADIPCRLQTTRQLAKDKLSTLNVELGHPPKAEWELVLRVNEKEQKRIKVNDQTAPDGWLKLNVSLEDFTGAEARIQLVQSTTGPKPTLGYWASLKLVETPLSQPSK